MSTPVYAMVTPLNTCRASLACRDVMSVSRRAVRQARYVWTRLDTSTLVKTFPYAKRHGLGSVSCRDVTSQVEFGFI